MTRTQVAGLAVALLAAAGVAGGAAWWLHVNEAAPANETMQPKEATQAKEAAPASKATQPKEAMQSNEATQPNAAAAVTAAPTVADRGTPTGEASDAPVPPPGASAPKTVEREPATERPATLPSKPSPLTPPTQAAIRPSFDVVRVEPHGDTVVAGKGTPNAQVALMSGGKVIAEARSDANGQFVILPPPLQPGDHDLTLRQRPQNGEPARDSAQSVAVSVPKTRKGSVVVALAEPGKATKLLSAPPEAPATAPPLPQAKVAIRSVELENGTGVFVSGTAAPGASAHIYLNDSHIADVVAGADGGWSVRVKKGLTGGHYVVRADADRGAGHTVASRAEVPFDVPRAMAAVPPSAEVASAAATPDVATAPPTPDVAATASGVGASDVAAGASGAGTTTGDGADAILDSVATARVIAGDNLWNISRYRLGDGKRYTQIYAANATQIRDPNLIYPGQVFVVPAR